ncbi:alpha-amylase family glycosyl hydrolase, partial [Streptococcus anginosus]|nr:alpha-amylase family glycosyl hydrolase [Streptococcus anginosus]
HTSNRHPWFQEALDPASDKRDWYIWRDPRPGATAHEVPAGQRRGDEPNDWTAAFNGPSWTWHKASQQYYLHLFAPEQPDLNWDNPQLRQAIFEMMRWWLDRGVDGFRMDVINLISKPEGFDQP